MPFGSVVRNPKWSSRVNPSFTLRALPTGNPYPGKGHERLTGVPSKPGIRRRSALWLGHRIWFGKARKWYRAPVVDTEPALPVGACSIAVPKQPALVATRSIRTRYLGHSPCIFSRAAQSVDHLANILDPNPRSAVPALPPESDGFSIPSRWPGRLGAILRAQLR